MAKEICEKDAKRIAEIEAVGIHVKILWESDRFLSEDLERWIFSSE